MGGVARRATIINEERTKGGAILVLDAGDSLSGDRDPAKRTQGETSVAAMNMMGYDGMALGPQDLALGLGVVKRRVAQADFAVLSANAVVSATGELVARPYIVRRFDGHTIAISGLSGGIDAGNPEIVLLDPVETARTIVAELTPQAGVIILLSHAGALIDQQIAETVPGIDLIISGGPFLLDTPWQSERMGTLILHADASSPGHAGRRVGIGRLTFDDGGRLIAQEWQRLSLGPEIAGDPTLAAWVITQR